MGHLHERFGVLSLQHDPEKWIPVFRKDHSPIKELERDDDSKKRHPALTRRCLAGKAAARRLRPADRIGKLDAGTRRSPGEYLARDDRGEGNPVHRSDNFVRLGRECRIGIQQILMKLCRVCRDAPMFGPSIRFSRPLDKIQSANRDSIGAARWPTNFLWRKYT
jgi:hypothetical protein